MWVLILWKEFSSFPLSHGTMIRKLLSPIIAFLYQDNTTGDSCTEWKPTFHQSVLN